METRTLPFTDEQVLFEIDAYYPDWTPEQKAQALRLLATLTADTWKPDHFFWTPDALLHEFLARSVKLTVLQENVPLPNDVTVRLWDNGGSTYDRYTAAVSDETNSSYWGLLLAQGGAACAHIEYQDAVRPANEDTQIAWEDLPAEGQQFIVNEVLQDRQPS